MKHGKKHRAEVAKSLPGWKRKFMSYKALKQQVKLVNPHFNGKKRSRLDNGKYSVGGSSERNSPVQDTGFTLLLDRELHKVNTFYIDKEEDYVISFRVILSDHLPFGKEFNRKPFVGVRNSFWLKQIVVFGYSRSCKSGLKT